MNLENSFSNEFNTQKVISYGLPKAVTNDIGKFIIINFTLILLMAATISTRLLGLGTSMVPIYWKKTKMPLQIYSIQHYLLPNISPL